MSSSKEQSGDERDAVIGVLQNALSSLEEIQVLRESGACESGACESGELDDSASAAPTGTALAEDPEYKRAKKRAMNMLAARDHSSTELREKLLRKEHPPYAVDALIDGLTRSHLLDDEAFAQAFVRAKREGRALSKQALRRELTKKGISGQYASAALEQVDDEFELALGVAQKKAATTVRLPEDTRKRRILGMLARRGFPSGICMRAADTALSEFPGDAPDSP